MDLKNLFEYKEDGSFKKVEFWVNENTYIFFMPGDKNTNTADSFAVMTRQDDFFKISGAKYGLLKNVGDPIKQYEAFINEVKSELEKINYYDKV